MKVSNIPADVKTLHVKLPIDVLMQAIDDGFPVRSYYSHSISYRVLTSDDKVTVIEAARANVHPSDNFDRKKGRAISAGRLMLGPGQPRGGRTYVTRHTIPFPLPKTGDAWAQFEDYIRERL